jgi:hypothetical protein
MGGAVFNVLIVCVQGVEEPITWVAVRHFRPGNSVVMAGCFEEGRRKNLMFCSLGRCEEGYDEDGAGGGWKLITNEVPGLFPGASALSSSTLVKISSVPDCLDKVSKCDILYNLCLY